MHLCTLACVCTCRLAAGMQHAPPPVQRACLKATVMADGGSPGTLYSAAGVRQHWKLGPCSHLASAAAAAGAVAASRVQRHAQSARAGPTHGCHDALERLLRCCAAARLQQREVREQAVALRQALEWPAVQVGQPGLLPAARPVATMVVVVPCSRAQCRARAGLLVLAGRAAAPTALRGHYALGTSSPLGAAAHLGASPELPLNCPSCTAWSAGLNWLNCVRGVWGACERRRHVLAGMRVHAHARIGSSALWAG